MNKHKLKEIVGEDWFTILDKSITREIEFDIDGVREQYSKTKVYPDPDKVWRCFQETKLKELKVILLGMEPYNRGEANGLCFDCRESPITASMKCINKAYDDYDPIHFNTNIMDGNLSEWAKQGVLLLNSSLTVEANKPGSHKHYWDKFIMTLLFNLSIYDPNIVVVCIGKQALNYITGTNFQYKIVLEHPAYAARQNRDWKHNNFFQEVNERLSKLNRTKIEW